MVYGVCSGIGGLLLFGIARGAVVRLRAYEIDAVLTRETARPANI